MKVFKAVFLIPVMILMMDASEGAHKASNTLTKMRTKRGPL